MDRVTYEWRVTQMIDAAYKAKSFNEKTLIIKNIVDEMVEQERKEGQPLYQLLMKGKENE